MFDEETNALAKNVIETALRNHIMLTVAESCTGGLVAALLTSIAGSSNVFDRGFVTYSNPAKHEMLGVSLDMLRDYGAVSSQVANAMAIGALKNSSATIAAVSYTHLDVYKRQVLEMLYLHKMQMIIHWFSFMMRRALALNWMF